VCHVDECLCKSIAQTAGKDRVKQGFHILTQSLADGYRDHTDTLEDGCLVRVLDACLNAESFTDMKEDIVQVGGYLAPDGVCNISDRNE